MTKPVLIAVVLGSVTGAAFGAEQKVDFAKDIQPIFAKHCYKCHGPEKQKGKFRLDQREVALKAGDDGPVIVPGKAADSKLYQLITLPKDNEDRMPNEGEPLAKAQTDLIRDWINQGAIWPESAVAATASGPTSPLDGLPKDFKPAAAEQAAIAKFAKIGVAIRPVAMNVPWREANFRLAETNVTDATLAPLKDVASLTELNLSRTKITDNALAILKNLPHLTRLHLAETKISDAGLAQLKGLKHLSFLNLYGTAVTDTGLEHLKGLRSLKQLYLWQTKVTSNGVARLQQALPQLAVSTGWEIETLVKKQEADAPKKN
jgi:mono/diheme cytochrome c family protein